MYRELVEHKISNRGVIVAAGDIRPEPANYPRYCSMFLFGKDIEAHVKISGSVRDFKGKLYCDAVWIDIDKDGDLDAAKDSAIQLVKRLNVEYQVNPDDLYIYFSGGKGFHIAIRTDTIGFSLTDAISSDKVKDFVRRLSNGIPHVDLAIYEPVRIFRIENSMNEKSGLYKVRISFDELSTHTINQIKELAKQPRIVPGYQDRKENAGLNAIWINSGEYVQEQKSLEYSTNLFAPPPEGGRNKTLLIQACTLFRKSELSNNAIYDILSSIAYVSNEGAKEPVTDFEIKRIVSNAERLVGDERKKPVIEDLQIKSFSEWIPEWENYILKEQTNMSLVFQDLNNLMKGRLKGKLGVVMGYGGSKKSLYALNVCLRNLKLIDEVMIYSTMEMSVPQLINRIIDHEVACEGYNANEIVAKKYKNDVNEGRKFLIHELGKEIGNKLQIIPTGRMVYDQYKKSVAKVKETVGTPAILVVDGLSMMGGSGSETEMYSRNSRELKELANEENILVILICHVSKGYEKHTRDLSRNVRGSEKILDNCDFYMTMSLIQDETNPEIHRQDIGFVSFHDKRGSGMTVDFVTSFDAHRLMISDSSMDPRMYYEAIKSHKRYESSDF